MRMLIVNGAVEGDKLTDRWQSGKGVLGMKLNLLMCDIRRTYSALQTIFDLCIPKKAKPSLSPKYQRIILIFMTRITIFCTEKQY